MAANEGVTIREVAAAAGVSTATVSRVMNGIPTVDPSLATRVQEAARRLGYRPNAVARGLVSGRTGLVGAVVPDLANPYFHGVLKGIASQAARAGYRLLVADSEESADEEFRLAQSLLGQVDGVILCSSRMSHAQLVAVAAERRPVVCANRALDGVGLRSVSIDEYEGALVLAGHLLAHGHRRVLYLAGPDQSWSNRQRWRGIRDARAFGLDPEQVSCGSDMAAGYEAIDAALATGATAVMAFNDFVAFGALARLRELGVRVPQDLSITGFDDIPFAAYASPALTTVRSPMGLLGQQSWRALAEVLAGHTDRPPERLKGELIVRASVSEPAAGPR